MAEPFLIEPIAQNHAGPLFDALDFDSVYEFLTSPQPMTVSDIAGRITRFLAGPPDGRDEAWLNFVVLIDNQLIGHIQATLVGSRAEVAYLFNPQVEGRGYATRATQWLIDYTGRTHGISEFWATTDPQNLKSIRLLRRCGFLETSVPAHGLLSYDEGDLVFRLMTREEGTTNV
jgi:RimJ/RimL family protein N-acetyltransferase